MYNFSIFLGVGKLNFPPALPLLAPTIPIIPIVNSEQCRDFRSVPDAIPRIFRPADVGHAEHQLWSNAGHDQDAFTANAAT